MPFVVDSRAAKEFALAHWVVGGTDGGRPFVRCLDAGTAIWEDIADNIRRG